VNRFVTYFRTTVKKILQCRQFSVPISSYPLHHCLNFISYLLVDLVRWIKDIIIIKSTQREIQEYYPKTFRLFFLHFKRLAPARIKKRIFFTSLFHPNGFWKSWWSLSIYSEVFDTIFILFYIFFLEGNFTCKWRLTIECVMICGNLYCKKGKERKKSHKKLRIFYGRLFVMKLLFILFVTIRHVVIKLISFNELNFVLNTYRTMCCLWSLEQDWEVFHLKSIFLENLKHFFFNHKLS